jgi:hypothetical protein
MPEFSEIVHTIISEFEKSSLRYQNYMIFSNNLMWQGMEFDSFGLRARLG